MLSKSELIELFMQAEGFEENVNNLVNKLIEQANMTGLLNENQISIIKKAVIEFEKTLIGKVYNNIDWENPIASLMQFVSTLEPNSVLAEQNKLDRILDSIRNMEFDKLKANENELTELVSLLDTQIKVNNN